MPARHLARYLPRGCQIALRHMYYGWQIRTGRFGSDEPEYALLDRWVQPGDWVLDIGANVGHYTLRLSQLVGPQGRVFAFEPIPETFSVLTANSKRAAYQNIALMNVAVSNKSSVAAMVIPKGRTGLDGHYFAHLSDGAAGKTGENGAVENGVYCCSIDSLQLPHPISLVKIDVEGHERQVLEGMRQLLRRDQPIVILEVTSSDLYEIRGLPGYTAEALAGSHNVVLRPIGRPDQGSRMALISYGESK